MRNWAFLVLSLTLRGMVRRPKACAAAWAWASVLSILGVTGCGSAEDRQLADLSRGVDHTQNAIDRETPRIDESVILAKRPPAQSDSAPGRGGRSVTSLDDGADPADDATDDPNDTTPRPVIRVVGVRGVQRGARALDQIDETIPDESSDGGQGGLSPASVGPPGPPIRTNAPTPAAFDAEAKRSYDAALALVNAHQFDLALQAFAAFLVRWPDHPNADNAMYWRGESYYAKGEYARAAEEFEGATLRFPLGNKVPDCLLKLGLCQERLGNLSKAKSYFERLTRDFPRSEAAHRIPSAEKARGAGPEENP
jgi:tol-pal system protein YbgF